MMMFRTKEDEDGRTYIPVSRIVAPDGLPAGVVFAGWPVALPDGLDGQSLPVGYVVAPINGSKAGLERAAKIEALERALLAALAEPKKGDASSRRSFAEALGVVNDIADILFANYSEGVREEIRQRLDIHSIHRAVAAAAGDAGELRVEPGAFGLGNAQAPAAP